MAKKDKYGSQDLKLEFPNDEACLEVMFDGLHTRQCSCGGTYSQLKGRRQFQCSKCRFQIAPQIGTIFEKSCTPLTLWFQALLMFSNAKSGLSAKFLERELNVTYKTAWRMLSLIRKALGQDDRPLSGTVEMDETYFGGKGNGGKYNKNFKKVMADKSAIIGAIERGGNARIKKVPNIQAHTLGNFLNQNVEVAGTRLLTDESNRYGLVAKGYNRETVGHGRKEYVRGDVHVNSVESFWSHIKRSIKGTHKVVSKKHLQSYLDGFAWHRNNRHNDRERFSSLLGILLHA
ncbi:MAG: ISSpo3, transposase [Parcubacteria group bacterium Gr01-1014_13]|nr:MAG: ISSpo3, transposase [Parcubacteria group bacterium Gr01-1014_13]